MDLELFRETAATFLGRPLDDAQVERILRLRGLLEEGNARASLTTRTELGEYLEVHALDSLALGRALAGEAAPPRTILDVGSGAGFPAFPLAIAYPDLDEIVALESSAKKCDFIRTAAGALGLAPRLRVDQRRAEEAGRDPRLRDRFDVVTARAVAEMAVLVELSLPFVRPGGLLVAWKTAKAEPVEIPAAARAIRELSGSLEAVLDGGVPGRAHRLVKIRKTGLTPEKYPRRVGVPERKPIA